MNFHKTFLFRKENIINNDVIIRQQIALRKEQLRVVEEGIYLLPNYIYAIREYGLEPSEEIQDDFYYVTRWCNLKF